MGNGDLMFEFDVDELWMTLDSPRGIEKVHRYMAEQSSPRRRQALVTRRGNVVRREPTPTPEHSPRRDPDACGRKRASSAYEYFGREARINPDSGSVTWVRIE